MRIVVLCEGRTEAALRDGLVAFVHSRTVGPKVGIKTIRVGGSIFNEKLARLVARHLSSQDVVGVIALTDVYPEFRTASDAKARITREVGGLQDARKFRVHVAKYDVEAWLIPFWYDICKSLKVKKQRPGSEPEEIDNDSPPSKHFEDLFSMARLRYRKVLEAKKWLTAERLGIAAQSCPELKLFLNSLLEFAGCLERL